jgi:hypothetical protein
MQPVDPNRGGPVEAQGRKVVCAEINWCSGLPLATRVK